MSGSTLFLGAGEYKLCTNSQFRVCSRVVCVAFGPISIRLRGITRRDTCHCSLEFHDEPSHVSVRVDDTSSIPNLRDTYSVDARTCSEQLTLEISDGSSVNSTVETRLLGIMVTARQRAQGSVTLNVAGDFSSYCELLLQVVRALSKKNFLSSTQNKPE